MEKNNRTFQDYLSFGYLYLLILGILKDSIYYGFLNLNILSYSSILDVLLSPVIYLFNNKMIPISILAMGGIIYLLFSYLPKFHKKSREKKWYRKLSNVEELDKRYAAPPSPVQIIKFVGILIFSFYMGTGIGGGLKAKSVIASGKFKNTHKLGFTDEQELEVKLIGHNSLYLFYVEQNTSDIIITPIEGNIKKIVKLKKVKD